MRSLQFDSLFKAIPPALIIKPDAPVFTLVDANEAYFKETGSKAEDIIGKGLFEALPHNPAADNQDMDELHSSIEWVIENKTQHFLPVQRYDIQIQGTKKFKQRYWVTFHSPVLDINGNLIYICQTVMDITSTIEVVNNDRIALQVAEAKRKQLYSLFMQAPVAIGVFLGNHYIVDLVNPNLAKLYGKTPEELLGKPLFDVLIAAKGIGFEQLLDNVLVTGKPYIGTEALVPLIRNNKLEYIYTNFVFEPFRDENDNIIGVVVIAIDVTKEVLTNRKLEESEQRLNMAIQNSDVGVFDTDIISGKSIRSLRHAQIFGYDDFSEEWTIDRFMEHVHPDDREFVKQEYYKSLEKGNVDLTFRIKRKDGAIRWINVVGKHSYDHNHKPVRCVGTTTDVTDKKELEKQKDQFISMVSHELKTPLTSIKAYAQLIGFSLKDEESKKNRGFLLRMQAQINRLEALIMDLLDISRMDTGKLLLHRSQFDLNFMLAELISDLQLVNLSHKLIVTQNDPASVFADRDKLVQVITNLVNNAVKYSPNADKVYISLSCNNDKVLFKIQDFGIGISEEKHNLVFERFHQISDVKQFSGLGLGLYISREIIHAEGGEIWLESIAGGGCTFYFTLPADKTACG